MTRTRGLKVLLGLFGVGVVVVGAGVGFAWYEIERVSRGRVYTNVEDLPERRVALVLGCARTLPGGGTNLYFKYRMEAVCELFASGKIEFVLVSGDNSRKDYDESSDMRDALVAMGVPPDRIARDFAGFSTLDSVVRAREVFLEDEMVVVSQDFHARRAVYIGDARGLDLVGYSAKDVAGRGGIRTRVRAYLARFKTVLDVTWLGREPRFLGDTIRIGGKA